MILKEDIEKVRATADLYDIVSATVTLKPSGTGTYVGLCPFHDEKTPSFSVRPALGVWHCFGCGLGGDVFGYVEHQENVDFRDAVELLADKYHIELRYDQSNAKKEHTGSKRPKTRSPRANCLMAVISARPIANDSVADMLRKAGIIWCGTWQARASHSRKCWTQVWPVKASMGCMTISVAA